MTRDEAIKLIGLIPESAFTRETGYGRTDNQHYVRGLKASFPEFNWRIILDRSGERTRWALTIDDDDPREHYFDTIDDECIHCGKSAREIARIGEVNGDDEFLDAVGELVAEARKQTAEIRKRELEGEKITADIVEMRLR
jgi:hypothetical protein